MSEIVDFCCNCTSSVMGIYQHGYPLISQRNDENSAPTNKLVPELLSSSQIFQYKHFLVCFWVDSSFKVNVNYDECSLPAEKN